MIEHREVERAGAIIHQFRYSAYRETTEWMEVARVWGDNRPRFFYGKPWQEHMEAK